MIVALTALCAFLILLCANLWDKIKTERGLHRACDEQKSSTIQETEKALCELIAESARLKDLLRNREKND